MSDALDRFEAELVEQVVQRVLDELARSGPAEASSPWLDANGAAEHLACSRERIYKRLREIPHHREGNRLLFHRAELDRYVEGFREGRQP